MASGDPARERYATGPSADLVVVDRPVSGGRSPVRGLLGQELGFESVGEEPHPARTYRVRSVHAQPADGGSACIVLRDDSDGFVVRSKDKVEALVPVVSARIEQAHWLIALTKLYGLSGALRKIAPKAGQREIIQLVSATRCQRDDVLDLKFLARQFLGREAVFTAMIRACRDLRIQAMAGPSRRHGVVPPLRVQRRSRRLPVPW